MEKYYIITPEMINLSDYIGKAKTWLEKAEASLKQVMNLKSL